MSVLSFGLVFFTCALALHYIIWKINLPRHHTKALLKIFFGTLTGGILLLAVLSQSISFLRLGPAGYIHLILFFTSLTLAYIITYSAVEVDSPSLMIIRKIAKAGESGLGRDELKRAADDALLIKPRVEDLVRDSLIIKNNNRYFISSRGVFPIFLGLIIWYRKALNLPKGG